jgi:cation/acetate symporter
MNYEPSWIAVAVFFAFVAITLAISCFLGNRARSLPGYFAAHGQIHWFVNGVAFAGDYLSAASFLGICGMIAFYGYDGFLYSIGYLAGWVVALFVIAEPMKRLGKFTFADFLNANFDSRGIKLAAGVSTLIVSVFYLIPQMVGAGTLIRPLLGFSHWMGVLMVGATVIVIVVSAGMVSTTYVQFLKGSLLLLFSLVLTVMVLERGLRVRDGGRDGHRFRTIGPLPSENVEESLEQAFGRFRRRLLQRDEQFRRAGIFFVEARRQPGWTAFKIQSADSQVMLLEAQTVTKMPDGQILINGAPMGGGRDQRNLHPVGFVQALDNGKIATGPLGPLSFFRELQKSQILLWGSQSFTEADGSVTTVYFQKPTAGSQILLPGEHPDFRGIRSDKLLDKLNFISLMLALFCGTASLPHILIRYYTVKDEHSARQSTIVGIGSIGFFYILTLYMGLGAMTSGAIDVTNSNMAAPLLARSISEWLFAIISALAFTTVLGTVSGLILASSGAVAHDLFTNISGMELTDREKVRIAKIASIVVGAIAIVLGILFEQMNVSYLVGWAFSVAASANLPSLIMLLFWKGVTRQGIVSAILVGMVSSLAWILLSADTFAKVYGMRADQAIVPFSQPGIVTIPLGFVVLIVVSKMTRPRPPLAQRSVAS